jgi:hypothetical protein
MRRTIALRTRAVPAETTAPQSTTILTTIGLITTLISVWLTAE